MNAARNVEPDQPVEQRDAGPRTAHGASDLRELRAITHPTEVREQHGTHAVHDARELAAREPIRVSTLCSVRTLATHRVRAAEVPASLRWEHACRAAPGDR